MDALEFEVRKEELLKECEVAPQVFDRVMPRLEGNGGNRPERRARSRSRRRSRSTSIRLPSMSTVPATSVLSQP